MRNKTIVMKERYYKKMDESKIEKNREVKRFRRNMFE